ncbi:AAA family ATPase [Blautia sp.]|uniref:AAA family ATPase n=1 Tax=Blautia sp. TaxID=1955243 RepID=UPI0025BE6E3E|nr:AAA family ATPase [Blautia sp.]
MARTVAIGVQDFEKLIEQNCFYIDKTSFIKEWWENKDDVTLITRPRRFGKTLNMSMMESFFSVKYAEKRSIFEGLSIWEDERYHKIQGTYPVISLSFANVKEKDYPTTRKKLCQLLAKLYAKHSYLLDSGILYETDIQYFKRVSESMDDSDASLALYQLSDYLYKYYGKKVIILLDEYDTPMQEAYVNGFWDELTSFMRSLFNASFKTNPYLERAVMTGITRVAKESIFSDLNNLKVVTTTSDAYATAFGFTEEEVFAALDEYGMENKDEVKRWYDGFTFGQVRDIYNPWSIINLLDTGKVDTYWANTSANSLVGKLIREGDHSVKRKFESLLRGGTIRSELDEQIVYNQLDGDEEAIWSLLLASGYLKVISVEDWEYTLSLTNDEVRRMFRKMIKGWFKKSGSNYNDFVQALLINDLDAMNEYMNRVSQSMFSYFDTGKNPSGAEPERFYHGFVLGLMVDLEESYILTSNRESGFGRYDVMLEPRQEKDDAILLEFKVFQPRKEKGLEDTVQAALRQIEDKDYVSALRAKGIPDNRIRKYGFAFKGKEVLIGEG